MTEDSIQQLFSPDVIQSTMKETSLSSPNPEDTQKKKRGRPKKQTIDSQVKFSVADVPCEVRSCLLRGRLAYIDEIYASAGKTAQLNQINQKIVDNYLQNRSFGDFDASKIDGKNCSLILANERTLFYQALDRIKRSGTEAKKHPRWQLAFENFRKEQKACNQFKDSQGNPKMQLEWEDVTPVQLQSAPSTDDIGAEIVQVMESSRKKRKTEASSRAEREQNRDDRDIELLGILKNSSAKFDQYLDYLMKDKASGNGNSN